jgi:hypothetical protein
MDDSKGSYRFDNVHQAPKKPGFYAWYYRFEVSDADIARVKQDLEAITDTGQRKEAMGSFLKTFIFKHFRETNYRVELKGKLKPLYSGEIEYSYPLGDKLLKRLADQPDLLDFLKWSLSSSLPYFASPLYIGLSDDLRRRLTSHKRLIEYYQDRKSQPGLLFEASSEFETLDEKGHSFAREVTLEREFFVPNLRVSTLVIPDELAKSGSELRDQLATVENILNRINFPLCGRS